MVKGELSVQVIDLSELQVLEDPIVPDCGYLFCGCGIAPNPYWCGYIGCGC